MVLWRAEEALMPTQLTSRRYPADDLLQAMELCFEKGWTDGLPVIPPTEPRVRALLDAAGLEPGREIAFIATGTSPSPREGRDQRGHGRVPARILPGRGRRRRGHRRSALAYHGPHLHRRRPCS